MERSNVRRPSMEVSDSTLELLRPFIYGDLLGNIAFVVVVVLLALLLMVLYKVVARVVGVGRAPRPLEETDAEAEEAELSPSAAEASQDSGQDQAEETGESEGDDE